MRTEDKIEKHVQKMPPLEQEMVREILMIIEPEITRMEEEAPELSFLVLSRRLGEVRDLYIGYNMVIDAYWQRLFTLMEYCEELRLRTEEEQMKQYNALVDNWRPNPSLAPDDAPDEEDEGDEGDDVK